MHDDEIIRILKEGTHKKAIAARQAQVDALAEQARQKASAQSRAPAPFRQPPNVSDRQWAAFMYILSLPEFGGFPLTDEALLADGAEQFHDHLELVFDHPRFRLYNALPAALRLLWTRWYWLKHQVIRRRPNQSACRTRYPTVWKSRRISR